MPETKFDGIESSAFREAARMMRFVGIFWIILAAIILAGAGVGMMATLGSAAMGHKPGAGPALALLLAAVDNAALMGAGIYTVLAAGSLRRSIESDSDQIGGMMIALTQLRRLFTFYAVVVGVDVLTDIIELAKG